MTALAPEKSAVDRFADPLDPLAEASRFLGLSESTFRPWARGYDVRVQGRHVTGNPVFTALGALGRRAASVPFEVDLMVPEHLAGSGSRRGVRIPPTASTRRAARPDLRRHSSTSRQ